MGPRFAGTITLTNGLPAGLSRGKYYARRRRNHSIAASGAASRTHVVGSGTVGVPITSNAGLAPVNGPDQVEPSFVEESNPVRPTEFQFQPPAVVVPPGNTAIQ